MMIVQCGRGRSGSVSTTYAHGDSVAITGSGFGTNSAALAFIGGATGKIEAATIGAQPTAGSGWTFEHGQADPLAYSDSERGQVLKMLVSSGVFNGVVTFDYGSAIAESTQYYWTFWAKADVSDAGTPEKAQWKLGRVNYENNYVDSDCELTMFNWFGATGKQFYVRRGSADNTTYYPGSDQYPSRQNEWARMELFVSTGTQGNADGSIYLVTHKNGARYEYSALSTAEVYNNTNRHRYFVHQNYWGNFDNGGQANRDTYLDDVAVSVGSWKRVELTDSGTLANSTVREFQPHTAWADGSVTVTLNKGGLSAGNYFLHVVSGVNTSLGNIQITVA